MQAIVTKYLGATNYEGARIRAKCQAKAITVHWRYGSWHRGDMPDGTGNCYVLAAAEPAFTLLKDGEA